MRVGALVQFARAEERKIERKVWSWSGARPGKATETPISLPPKLLMEAPAAER